jgi:hypothetical protein
MDIEKYQTFFGCIEKVDQSMANDKKGALSKPE